MRTHNFNEQSHVSLAQVLPPSGLHKVLVLKALLWGGEVCFVSQLNTLRLLSTLHSTLAALQQL